MANIIKAKSYYLMRRDTLNNWESKNPVLMAGEVCLVTDAKDSSKMIKICTEDNTRWLELEYFSMTQGTVAITVDQTYNPESENAQSGKAVAEALKDIDISEIDVSGKMDKFGSVTQNADGSYVVAANKASMNLNNLNANTILNSEGEVASKIYVDEAVKKIEIPIEIKNTLDEIDSVLFSRAHDYTENVLTETYITNINDTPTVTISGNTINYSTTYISGQKWLAFPISSLTNNTSFDFEITIDNPNNINYISLNGYLTSTDTGFSRAQFTQNGNKYTLTNVVNNNGFLAFLIKDVVTSFTATIEKIIPTNAQDVVKIIPQRQLDTSVYGGKESGEVNIVEGAGSTNDLGRYNTGVGTRCMRNNTEGHHNSAFGYQALMCNTAGAANTGFGEDALFSNTTGNSNTVVGTHGMQFNTTGTANVGVGENCGINNTTGYQNVFIGAGVAATNTNQYQNVVIGHGADVAAGNSRCIVIGKSAKSTKSNQCVIGSTDITEVVFCGNKKINFNTDGTVTWEALD